MRRSSLLLFGIATVVVIGLIPRQAAAGLADVAANPADNAAMGAKAKDDAKKLSENPKPPPKPKRTIRSDEANTSQAEAAHSESRLSNKPVPLRKEHTDLPERNPPIVEWNLPFLGPGNIIQGFKIPTGAVWQPAFWVFGDFQTSAGIINDGINPTRQYASARADINGNLQLTPTERIVIGFTPLSQGGNLGTGLLHVDGQGTSFVNALNPNIQTLFFEGDTRQLFPGIDSDDRNGLDFGFAVGKQWINFQDGVMINDNIQALGITKDTIQIPAIGTQDMRITGLFGWADIRRNDTFPDSSAYLLGVFTETDFRKSTVDIDFSYVGSDNPKDPFGVQRGGSGAYFGASSTQRFGAINTTFRVNTSSALDGTGTAVDNGALIMAEVSRTMQGSNDLIYANFFGTAGNYTSAARSGQVAGPLERIGILFSPLAAGLAGSPIPGDANHAFGGALGYQMFFGIRNQLTLEIAGKVGREFINQGLIPLNDPNLVFPIGTLPIGLQNLLIREPNALVNESVVALGGQYVFAVTSRTSIQVNAFVLDQFNANVGYGLAVGTTTRW
jgi:hypothetical protein